MISVTNFIFEIFHSNNGSNQQLVKEKVNHKDIVLVRGRGSKNTGGGSGGFFWHIYYKDKKVGKVFINYNVDKQEPYIQIFVNKNYQGKGIGRIAYKKACEASGYDRIFAEIRKSNIPSIKAAEAAGFVAIGKTPSGQIKMVWIKK